MYQKGKKEGSPILCPGNLVGYDPDVHNIADSCADPGILAAACLSLRVCRTFWLHLKGFSEKERTIASSTSWAPCFNRTEKNVCGKWDAIFSYQASKKFSSRSSYSITIRSTLCAELGNHVLVRLTDLRGSAKAETNFSAYVCSISFGQRFTQVSL